MTLDTLRNYLLKWRTTLDRKRLIEDRSPIPVIDMGHAQDDDTVPRLSLNADGEVTEASAAEIATNTQNTSTYLRYARTLWGPGGLPGAADENQKRILQVPVVTDAAGDSAITELVPALAGNRSCMRLDYIYATGADPAWDFTIDSTTGFEGPNTMIALVSLANEIGPDWARGIYYRNTAVAENLTVVIANGGNIITYYFIGLFWYE